MKLRRFLAHAAAAALATGSAFAADMGYAPPPSFSDFGNSPPVEIGTGWYLRGDASWSRGHTAVIAPNGSVAADSLRTNGWAAGLGFGYQINDWFRVDMTLDRRNIMRTRSRTNQFQCTTNVLGVNDANNIPVGIAALNDWCYATQDATLRRTSLLANFYVDLGTWAGVTPYVGAGVGFTHGKIKGDYDWSLVSDNSRYQPNIQYPSGFPPNWTIAPAEANFSFGQQSRFYRVGSTRYNFTWSLMAGMALAVSPNAKIDLGYRFVNVGSFGSKNKKEGQLHEYRVGLRYMID